MSKYVTAQEFEKWTERYYREFCMNKDFVVHAFGAEATKQHGVIIVNLRNGKIARSYCHPDDEWDWKTGVAVAYANYMGVEVPQVEKGYFIRNLVGKEVMIPTYSPSAVFVTPYTKDGFVLVVDSLTGYTFKVHPHVLIREHDIKSK